MWMCDTNTVTLICSAISTVAVCSLTAWLAWVVYLVCKAVMESTL